MFLSLFCFEAFSDPLIAELPDCLPRSSQKVPQKCQNQNFGRGIAIWRKIAQNFCKLAGKEPTFLAFFGEKSPLLVTLVGVQVRTPKLQFCELVKSIIACHCSINLP